MKTQFVFTKLANEKKKDSSVFHYSIKEYSKSSFNINLERARYFREPPLLDSLGPPERVKKGLWD